MMSIQNTLYLNERTGHLLNLSNRSKGVCGLYHKLLKQHTTAFKAQFSNENLFSIDDTDEIRFIWDNIISELQRMECLNIVLCPHSRQSVCIDPNLLLLQPNDHGKMDFCLITFRTLRCIRNALNDRNYIASENNDGNAINATFLPSVGNTSIYGSEPSIILKEYSGNRNTHNESRSISLTRACFNRDATPNILNDTIKDTNWGSKNARNNEETVYQTAGSVNAFIAHQKSSNDDEINKKFKTGTTHRQSGVWEDRTPFVGSRLDGRVWDSLPKGATNYEVTANTKRQRTNREDNQGGTLYSAYNNSSKKHSKEHSKKNKKEESTCLTEIARQEEQLSPQPNSPGPTNLRNQREQTVTKELSDKVDRKSWETRYDELLQHFLEHGHFDVKQSKSKGLASFVKKLRYNRSRKQRGLKQCLSDEREKRLDRLGFHWISRRSAIAPKNSQQPEGVYRSLKEYGRRHRNTIVALGDPRYSWFESWVKSRLQFVPVAQRMSHEIQLMGGLGFRWTHSVELIPPAAGESTANPVAIEKQPAPPIPNRNNSNERAKEIQIRTESHESPCREHGNIEAPPVIVSNNFVQKVQHGNEMYHELTGDRKPLPDAQGYDQNVSGARVCESSAPTGTAVRNVEHGTTPFHLGKNDGSDDEDDLLI